MMIIQQIYYMEQTDMNRQYNYIYIYIYIYYIYTIANSHIKFTDRCYIRNIHPTTDGYETTGLI